MELACNYSAPSAENHALSEHVGRRADHWIFEAAMCVFLPEMST